MNSKHPRFGAYPVACRMYANEPEIYIVPEAKKMANRIRAAGGSDLVDLIRAAQSDAPLLAAEGHKKIAKQPTPPVEEPEATSTATTTTASFVATRQDFEALTVSELRELIADHGGAAPPSRTNKAGLVAIAESLG